MIDISFLFASTKSLIDSTFVSRCLFYTEGLTARSFVFHCLYKRVFLIDLSFFFSYTKGLIHLSFVSLCLYRGSD